MGQFSVEKPVLPGSTLSGNQHARPVVTKLLNDPDEQLSYCIKFVDYRRPGRKRVPLKPDRLVELAAWSSRYRFEDFLFVYGVPRPGGRIVVSKLSGDPDASARGQGPSRKSALNSLRTRIVAMPVNRNNKAPPRATESPIKEAAWSSPAERPPLDEWSRIRADIAAAVAEVRAEFRTGPADELIREIEADLVHCDPIRRHEDKVLARKYALQEKKEAARLERMNRLFPETED